MGDNRVRVRLENVTLRFRTYREQSPSIAGALYQTARSLLRPRKIGWYTALDSVSVTLHEGETVGIIGPNGGGKTTLLRVVSGIYPPDEGYVETQGSISNLLSLGTGFDNRLSGLENIRLNCLVMGLSMDEIDRLTEQIVDFAEIGPRVHLPLRYYSSGMISRLSFATVLALQPDILLIDEVFSVGDLSFKERSEAAMRDLMARASCQLVVTHNLSYVRNECTRALFIEGGRIVADGEPRDVVKEYTTWTKAKPRK